MLRMHFQQTTVSSVIVSLFSLCPYRHATLHVIYFVFAIALNRDLEDEGNDEIVGGTYAKPGEFPYMARP